MKGIGFHSLAVQILLDDFACCETWTNGVDLYLHFVARFGLWDENYEAFDPSDSVTATACLFDLNFVFLPLFHWLVEGTFITHTSHLGICFS
jgi:hypothetical protein